MLKRAILGLLLAIALSDTGAWAAGGDKPVILTLTGALGKSNRPPFDGFKDILFAHLGESFEKAYQFSREDLLALPQAEITVKYPNWPRSVTAKGPRLNDVLAEAEAGGTKVVVQAVDGYAPQFDRDKVAQGQFILALEVDGAPLAMGGHGPLWLVYPPASQDVEDDAGLAWAVFHIALR